MSKSTSIITVKDKFPPVLQREIIELIRMSEKEVMRRIYNDLRDYRIPFVAGKQYRVTTRPGTLPLICVHTDTVNHGNNLWFNIEQSGDTLSLKDPQISRHIPSCLGADDRAGVWVALQLLGDPRFNFGFFAGEEKGCIGSRAFALDYPQILDKCACFIGLDRASKGGKQNLALYGCDNKSLVDLFPDFEPMRGSFSDCSCLAEETGLACVNLSVGYDHEHTVHETLDLSLMIDTLNTLKKAKFPPAGTVFKAEKKSLLPSPSRWISWSYDSNWTEYRPRETEYECKNKDMGLPIFCDYCGRHEPLYETGLGDKLCETCLERALAS